MANRTAWTGGNLNSGLGWANLFNSADLASLGSASAVMSSAGAFTNGTGLDMFMDVSISLAIASTTLTAGANFALYLYQLNQDGSTYGDNAFSAGTGSSNTITNTHIGQSPVASFAFPITGSATTTLIGFAQQIIIPPGTFVCALANWTAPATALSSGTQTVKFRSYNINLNN
jgi:hypothetical protein